MSDELRMPYDWDDHAGREACYAALPSDDFWYESRTTSAGSFGFDRLGSLIDHFPGRKWTTLWFPGCGFSPLPRAFATFGFTVYATDIAPSAIQYQLSNDPVVKPLLGHVTVGNGQVKSGSLVAEIHDFRSHFGDEKVDAIFNVKSIQGFSGPSMASACRSHFAALRSGGVAYFDTINFQGHRRDELEDALAEAGFHVPLRGLNKWYRHALNDTGIEYLVIHGGPMIPQREDYGPGSSEYNRDRDILFAITGDYQSRIQSEFDKERESVTELTKSVQVIYSTG